MMVMMCMLHLYDGDSVNGTPDDGDDMCGTTDDSDDNVGGTPKDDDDLMRRYIGL